MALIPPFFLDCVVAIGERGQDATERFYATGFLYGKLVRSADRPEDNRYHIYLVTNRHVLVGATSIILRFNALGDTPALTFDLSLQDGEQHSIYSLHTDVDVDVGVIPINGQLLNDLGIRFHFFAESTHAMTLQTAASKGVSEGDGIFLLGFPMGDAGNDQNYVVARQGIIARIRDALAGKSKYYLIDSATFPGNSGGPVITKPEITSIQGTAANENASLIGIAAGYVPYQDVAVSTQTKRPRIIFEENSGLGVVFAVDCIMSVVEVAEQKSKVGLIQDIHSTGQA